MKAKITEQGLLLPKEWFPNCTEVEIRFHKNRIEVLPLPKKDALYQLGTHPIDDPSITDLSTNHDRYLYGENGA